MPDDIPAPTSAPLPQDEPGKTPPQEPTQPPPGTPQLSAETLAEAMVKAYRTAVPAAPMTPPAPARDWLESLTPAQQEGLRNQFLTDPVAAARFVSEQSAQRERAALIAEAAPLVQNQAQMIVDMYVQRKATGARGQEVADAFRRSLQGINLAPLVPMGQAQRDHELDLRWDAAFGQVARKYEGQTPPPAPRPDPTLLAQNGPGGAPASRKFESDPGLVAMAKMYGFTSEQIREIEEVM